MYYDDEALTHSDTFSQPTGTWEETWAKHHGDDPTALIWRNAQINRRDRELARDQRRAVRLALNAQRRMHGLGAAMPQDALHIDI